MTITDMIASVTPKPSASAGAIRPTAVGRRAVRGISRSMSWS
jgi:hypothetical protein